MALTVPLEPHGRSRLPLLGTSLGPAGVAPDESGAVNEASERLSFVYIIVINSAVSLHLYVRGLLYEFKHWQLYGECRCREGAVQHLPSAQFLNTPNNPTASRGQLGWLYGLVDVDLILMFVSSGGNVCWA